MMKILSINKPLHHDTLSIENIAESELVTKQNIEDFDYIIINGGDGTIRRVVKILHTLSHNAKCILNPTGSFNVVAKLHNVPKLIPLLEQLSKGHTPQTKAHKYYKLNHEVFLFSAGNMGDLQHIFLAETLRFGILKKGMLKYIVSALFLLPFHIVMTPFMLMSKRKFFIFTPASFISKFGSFYGKVENMKIDLENGYNHIELDGDIVTIKESILDISYAGTLDIVHG